VTQAVEAKGFKIPIVGLGTWTLRGSDCARLTEQAIRIGYRHIDTAQMYDNEREVGEGVRASGLRAEVMVTTKVQPTLLAPHDLERSVKESLARLRLDVIDLLLIHWPNPRVPLAETLGAMAKMKREGDKSGFRISPSRCLSKPTRFQASLWSATRSNVIRF
jgi:diketogulonate reductase-like aldo/keto reductase